MPGDRPIMRAYRPEDREPVVRLLAGSDPWRKLGYGDEDWSRLFRTDGIVEGREGYVLEADGAVAGVALLRPKFLMGDYLELLAIAPATRNKGYGALLLAQIEAITFARAKNLFACVSDFNDGARRFYVRQGYREIGPMPNLLIPGNAELLLRKTMGPARTR
ncbi:MAG: GNAT family N-acetyltransferase [Nitrospirae bacterium]|nr:MAG: GNAT family N-acetyltransferase [Nitrospirota bacterium]